ncbi:hypothetical protein N8653_05960 [Euryarchaeota archaeon]|nr:hypothetical protein [Euryarchaeota archaeon]
MRTFILNQVEGNNSIRVKVLGSCKFIENDDHKNEKVISQEKYDKWFSNYINKLPFSKYSKLEVKNKSQQISDLINKSFENFDNEEVWSKGRLRKGMVVGSVQSGKTASMLGVIGKCIDESTKIVVLLSGTKISLWHQTLLRLYGDLDNQNSGIRKTKSRLILPNKNIVNLDKSSKEKIFISTQQKQITQSLNDPNKVLIFIIPKISEHIIDLAKVIQKSIKSISNLGRQHMLVIDDESDDASILDARKTKKIPYHITRLWAGVEKSNEFDQTFSEDLFATYLAYTATPQANILQSENNPLSPKDFLFTIRTPSSVDDGINFIDKGGIVNYYTGGEIFYEQDFSNYSLDTNFIQRLTFDKYENPNLLDSIKAYVVGAAINMLSSGKRYTDQCSNYPDMIAAEKFQIPNYSMIYHPTAMTEDHFLGKQQIIYCINNGTLINFQYDGKNLLNQYINPEKFKQHFLKDEEKWKRWKFNFNSSINFVNENFNSKDFSKIIYEWSDIKSVILNEIIPEIKIRVINSSSDADDRPRFESESHNNGEWTNVPDKLSIFVAGNVLSRGLTIENLAVTVFGRVSTNPAADTQMQMQRWFGYRGKILPYCRIFMEDNQLALFRNYHKSDKSLKERIQLVENNIKKSLDDELPWILEGKEYRSTLKIDTTKLPLRPYNYSQFGLVEPSDKLRLKNKQSVDNFIQETEFIEIIGNKGTTGYVSIKPYSSDRIADLLDELEFSNHSPSLQNPDYHRWNEYANLYGSDLLTKLSEEGNNISCLSIRRCPYTIAAYLRFWTHVSKKENIPNNDLFVFPSNSYWKDYISKSPDFYVTIRNGSGSEILLNDKLKQISVKHAHRNQKDDTEFNNVWGSAGGGEYQYDDKIFDYHIHDYKPVPKDPSHGKKGIPFNVRPNGHPGHLAIYFLKEGNKTHVGLGVGLPSGSPDHIRSMRG